MTFFWYDDQILASYMKSKYQWSHLFENSEQWYKGLYQINQLFSKSPWGLIHDNSDFVPNPYNIVSHSSYRYQKTSMTFEEISVQTAQHIVDTANKPIAVLWSGGIDSTVALTALAMILDNDQITVVMNQQSIEEHPSFYQYKIKDKMTCISHEQWYQNYSNYFTVSGDGGDNIWAVLDESFYTSHSEIFNLPWKQWKSTQELPPGHEFIQKFCDNSGVQIRTVLELRTWFYLCCKWQDKLMRLYAHWPNLRPTQAVSFYGTDNNFKHWTMNNMDQLVGTTWINYKIPAKQFIDNFHHDAEWTKNKTKKNSGTIVTSGYKAMFVAQKPVFAIDSNFEAHAYSTWPFVDIPRMDSWNDQYQLW